LFDKFTTDYTSLWDRGQRSTSRQGSWADPVST